MERELVLSDFSKTPGGLVNGIWEFPPIESLNNATGKPRSWSIRVEIPNAQIKTEWITGVEAPPSEVIYYTISGQNDGIKTRSANKIVKEGKVKRNVLQQALSEAMSEWRKQKKKAEPNKLIKPQLLQEFTPETINAIYKKWPQSDLYVSYKYNGVRIIASLDENGDPCIYSRTLNKYDIPHITESLRLVLKNDMILDGELYIHDVHLNIISGLVRSGKDTKYTDEEKELRLKIKFYIFDILKSKIEPFEIRYKELLELEKLIEANNINNLKIIRQMIIKFQPALYEKMRALMIRANDRGMEGLVMRVGSALYDESDSGYHSINALKIKPVLSDEFVIIDFDQGEGKNAEVIKLTCALRGDINKTFSVAPMGTVDDKKSIYNKCRADPSYFEKNYKGKLITIEFAEWTKTGLPSQGRAIALRDYD
jgi:ATP-dependent DNA ligase